MKKQTKRKLEHELSLAVGQVLAKYNGGAVSKTKKVIAAAGKNIVKKFSKSIKSMEKEADSIRRKAKTKKKSVAKRIVVKKPRIANKPMVKKAVAKKVRPVDLSTPVSLTHKGNELNS